MAHLVEVVFFFDEQADFFEFLDDGAAHLEAILASVFAAQFGELTVFGQAHQLGQVVALADLKVGGIVGGRDFQRARAKIDEHRVIADDGNLAVGDGDLASGPDQVLKPLVFRVHGHGHVGKDGFWTGGCDHHRPIVQIIKTAVGLFVLDL